MFIQLRKELYFSGMKIRIKGNSVRVRLSRSEVDKLAEDGRLEEKTEFVNDVFIYALQAKEGISALEAGFEANTMTMYIPAGIPQQWAANETVGYSNNMEIGEGRQLFLLLEKDFKCIDADVSEDQSDNFDNPLKAC